MKKTFYTNGCNLYYYTFENGLYWVLHEVGGKCVYFGGSLESRTVIKKLFNLKRVK